MHQISHKKPFIVSPETPRTKDFDTMQEAIEYASELCPEDPQTVTIIQKIGIRGNNGPKNQGK